MSDCKKEKTCPYRDTIIIVHSGLDIYWCRLFPYNTKKCISQDHFFDYEECSYYLFPKDTIIKEGNTERWLIEV